MTTPAIRRQIRHPHTQFTGVDGLGPLPSPGPGSTLGNRSGNGSGSSPGQSASRRLSKTRPNNGYFWSKYKCITRSPPPSLLTKGPSRSRVGKSRRVHPPAAAARGLSTERNREYDSSIKLLQPLALGMVRVVAVAVAIAVAAAAGAAAGKVGWDGLASSSSSSSNYS